MKLKGKRAFSSGPIAQTSDLSGDSLFTSVSSQCPLFLSNHLVRLSADKMILEVVGGGRGKGKKLLFVYVCRSFKKQQSYLGYQITFMAGALGAGRYSKEVQTVFFQTLLLRLSADAVRKDWVCLTGKNAKKLDAFH